MNSIAGVGFQEAVAAIGVWLPWVVLISARVGIAMASMPAPFGSLAPTPLRAAIGVALAMAMAVGHGEQRPEQLPEGVALMGAAFGEMLIGAVIGLTVRVTLAAAEVAGTVAGFTMGLGFAQSVDPMYGEQASPPTRMLATLGTLIFFVFEGHHTVIRALSSSLTVAPPGDVMSVVVSDGVISLGSRMLARGLQIAAPVLGTMLIVQTGTALASRAAPKVPLMYLSFAITTGAGVLILFISAPSVATAIVAEVRHLPVILSDLLGGGV